MFEKLKSLLADDGLYMACLLVLVGITSFGLGRLSSLESGSGEAKSATVVLSGTEVGPKAVSKPTTTVATPTTVAAEPTIDPKTAPFVASKSGTKYHKISCPGAKQIKETNKIYFMTQTEAEAAGYTKASNCKGL